MIEFFIGILRTIGCFFLTFVVAFLASASGLFLGGQRAWEYWRGAWSRAHLFFLGAKVKVGGKENLKGPAVFIMNHESVIDLFTIGSICPEKTTFISKKEVARFPFVGVIMRMGGCIFIDRSNTRSAIESIRNGLKERRENYSIIVFPEGTRTAVEEGLKPFKRGCMHVSMEAGIPIVPIGHAGAADYANGKSIIMKRGGTVFVEVGEPIDTSKWTQDNTKSQMEFLHQTVKNLIEKAKLKKLNEEKELERNLNNNDFSTKSL
ncbi:MAG: lysophospholipid acyltransferase family protein [Bdellovibrionota bacterium]|nr:lysophospholipid acyltransferase family protein [Bdellovibrionota bacterium]